MMKLLAGVTIAAALLGASVATAGTRDEAPPQITFKLRVFESDPLGSPEAGTVKVLADSRLTTLEHRPFTFVTGGELPIPGKAGAIDYIPVGRSLQCVPTLLPDGRLRLDITLANAEVVDRSEDHTELRTQSMRRIMPAKTGEILKLRWPGGTAERQSWVELSAQLIDR
jgi:hypothetical protein